MKELKGIKLVIGYIILGLLILVGAICLITMSPFFLAFWIGDKIKDLTAFVWIYLSDSVYFAGNHFGEIAWKVCEYFDKPEDE